MGSALAVALRTDRPLIGTPSLIVVDLVAIATALAAVSGTIAPAIGICIPTLAVVNNQTAQGPSRNGLLAHFGQIKKKTREIIVRVPKTGLFFSTGN
jgi:hypothetical protein